MHISGALRGWAPHGFTHAMRVSGIDARVAQESSNQNISGGHMNWDQIEGKWKEMKGQLREKWGNLTDNDLEMIAGRRDQLIGRLQIRYGLAKKPWVANKASCATEARPGSMSPALPGPTGSTNAPARA